MIGYCHGLTPGQSCLDRAPASPVADEQRGEPLALQPLRSLLAGNCNAWVYMFDNTAFNPAVRRSECDEPTCDDIWTNQVATTTPYHCKGAGRQRADEDVSPPPDGCLRPAGDTFAPDLSAADARAVDFAALVLPGGVANPTSFVWYPRRWRW